MLPTAMPVWVERCAGLLFIKEARKINPNLLLFDCGDISQGTPYYNLFQGEVEVKMMNLMGYDAMTIGNHEFDFGFGKYGTSVPHGKFPGGMFQL